MCLSDGDEQIVVGRRDLLAVLRQLEMIVVSLDHVGSATAEASEVERALVLQRFMTGWNVYRRLAKARRVLGDYFSDELGSDDMGELERELQAVPCWSISSQAAPNDGFGERTTRQT